VFIKDKKSKEHQQLQEEHWKPESNLFFIYLNNEI
jgi:hypothetical protein